MNSSSSAKKLLAGGEGGTTRPFARMKNRCSLCTVTAAVAPRARKPSGRRAGRQVDEVVELPRQVGFVEQRAQVRSAGLFEAPVDLPDSDGPARPAFLIGGRLERAEGYAMRR